jgi:nucleotide sugar dehydrogenase
MKIGCIGQGWVGKNIADNFERRHYSVVRYALEPEYALNRRYIKDCDVVFIAVPTPTTPEGFDFSIVEEMVSLVGDGKIAVIKSTVLPGVSRKIQDTYPSKVVLFSPEFLCESTAVYDVGNPMFNIIGMAYDSAGHRSAAEEVMRVLPHSRHNFIVRAEAAELFKYAHNINGFMRVVFSNLLHDVADKVGVDWADVKMIMDNDPMMSPYYNSPVHKGGRGAGGHCFIKDMAAFSKLYSELCPSDIKGIEVFKTLESKNLELLASTGKNQDLVKGVYGTL